MLEFIGALIGLLLLSLCAIGMATPQFAPGIANKVNFTPAGGAATDINIVDWNWQETITEHDTTHSGSGGVEERLASVLRGRGGATANYDIANQHHKAPLSLVVGQKGLMKFHVSATLFYAVPVMILEIPIKSAVAGKVEFTFTAGLSGDAGTYVRPL